MKKNLTLNLSLILWLILLLSGISIHGQESDKIELVNLEIFGNESFDNSELEDIIISKESSSWYSQFFYSFTSFGSPATYFDSLNLQDDVDILYSFYQSNGFFKTIINTSYEIEHNDLSEASLVFSIIEKEPAYIRNYTLNGLTDLPKYLFADILELVNTDSSNRYSERLLDENNSIIINFLRDKGYMLVQSFNPIVEIDTVKNKVDVTVDYKLGKRYRIQEVQVEKSGPGKYLVSDQLIRDITNISVDKYYDYSDLKLAQIRLYRTNLFSSAVVAGSVQDTVGEFVPVNIITKVGLLNEFSPELILINEESTLKFGLGLTFSNKNFLGDARKLTIGTSFAAQNITEFIKEANLTSDNIFGYADARIGIEQPFFLGKPINTKLETFYTLEKRKNNWNARIYGSKLNLNFELPQYIYLTSLSTSFSWQNSNYIFNEDYLLTILPDSAVDGNLTSNKTTTILGVQLGANKTDDFLFPTKGYSVSILAEDGNSIPYLISRIGNYGFDQSAAYYKLVLTATSYIPNFKSIFDSFGTKLKIGNIQSYKGNINDIPYNQRFTSGGSNSIRGWQAYELPNTERILPQNLTPDEIENIARNITPGGFFLLEGSIEAREFLSEKIGTAIFLDYGNVWESHKKFRYDEIAVAAGFGFRYYSDFAPIRLDFGFKAYDPDDRRSFYTRLRRLPFFKTFEFHIGIGEAF